MYAEQCQKLAAKALAPEDQQALETIARAWDRIANAREAMLLKQVDRRTGVDPSTET